MARLKVWYAARLLMMAELAERIGYFIGKWA